MTELLQIISLSGLAGTIIVLCCIIMSKDKKLKHRKKLSDFYFEQATSWEIESFGLEQEKLNLLSELKQSQEANTELQAKYDDLVSRIRSK